MVYIVFKIFRLLIFSYGIRCTKNAKKLKEQERRILDIKFKTSNSKFIKVYISPGKHSIPSIIKK